MDASSFCEQREPGAAQQLPSPKAGPTALSRGSQAIPLAAADPVTKQSVRVEEAREMCPEGHELSESYGPGGVQGTPGGAASCASLTAHDGICNVNHEHAPHGHL